jgi:hypothetical protein
MSPLESYKASFKTEAEVQLAKLREYRKECVAKEAEAHEAYVRARAERYAVDSAIGDLEELLCD